MFWGCVQCSNADHNVGGDWSLQILGSSWYKSSPFTSWDKSSIDILLCMLQLQMNGMLRCVTTMHGRYEFMHTQRTCSECTPAAVAHSDNNGETTQTKLASMTSRMNSSFVLGTRICLQLTWFTQRICYHRVLLRTTLSSWKIPKVATNSKPLSDTDAQLFHAIEEEVMEKKFSEHWRKTTWPAQNASIAENEIWNIWSTCKYDCACVNLFACHN